MGVASIGWGQEYRSENLTLHSLFPSFSIQVCLIRRAEITWDQRRIQAVPCPCFLGVALVPRDFWDLRFRHAAGNGTRDAPVPALFGKGFSPPCSRIWDCAAALGQGSKGGYSQDFSCAWQQCLEAPSWHIGLCFSFQAPWLEK